MSRDAGAQNLGYRMQSVYCIYNILVEELFNINISTKYKVSDILHIQEEHIEDLFIEMNDNKKIIIQLKYQTENNLFHKKKTITSADIFKVIFDNNKIKYIDNIDKILYTVLNKDAKQHLTDDDIKYIKTIDNLLYILLENYGLLQVENVVNKINTNNIIDIKIHCTNILKKEYNFIFINNTTEIKKYILKNELTDDKKFEILLLDSIINNNNKIENLNVIYNLTLNNNKEFINKYANLEYYYKIANKIEINNKYIYKDLETEFNKYILIKLKKDILNEHANIKNNLDFLIGGFEILFFNKLNKKNKISYNDITDTYNRFVNLLNENNYSKFSEYYGDLLKSHINMSYDLICRYNNNTTENDDMQNILKYLNETLHHFNDLINKCGRMHYENIRDDEIIKQNNIIISFYNEHKIHIKINENKIDNKTDLKNKKTDLKNFILYIENSYSNLSKYKISNLLTKCKLHTDNKIGVNSINKQIKKDYENGTQNNIV